MVRSRCRECGKMRLFDTEAAIAHPCAACQLATSRAQVAKLVNAARGEDPRLRAYFEAAEFQNVDKLMRGTVGDFIALGVRVAQLTKDLAAKSGAQRLAEVERVARIWCQIANSRLSCRACQDATNDEQQCGAFDNAEQTLDALAAREEN